MIYSVMEVNLLSQRLTNLKLEPSDNLCAECGKEDPRWVSVNLGVFICFNCASIHQLLGAHISKVQSVHDKLTEDMLEAIIGNRKAKEKWEANVPLCWVPPSPESPLVCREQWIRAKYERKEFVDGDEAVCVRQPSYLSGVRQGFLMKKMRHSDVFKKRWFVLSAEYLTYFKSYQDRLPKCAIPLTHLNVTLQGPGLDYHHCAMLVVFKDDSIKASRNIFVHSDNGKEIMDWYLCIRMARIKLLYEAFPHHAPEDIERKATLDIIKWGYLLKMPPNHSRFQKRLFVLDQESLKYYNKPRDAVPLGEIILGPHGCWVDETFPEKMEHNANMFMLHVPNRPRGGFPLLVESLISKKAWMDAIQSVIDNCRGSSELHSSQSTYEKEASDENGASS